MRQEDDEDGGEGSPEAAFEAYCCAVENSAAWGGQLELRALAQALRRHIAVYSVGMPRVDMGTEFQGGVPFNFSPIPQVCRGPNPKVGTPSISPPFSQICRGPSSEVGSPSIRLAPVLQLTTL